MPDRVERVDETRNEETECGDAEEEGWVADVETADPKASGWPNGLNFSHKEDLTVASAASARWIPTVADVCFCENGTSR